MAAVVALVVAASAAAFAVVAASEEVNMASSSCRDCCNSVYALVLVALNAVEVCKMEDSMILAEVAVVKAVATAAEWVGWLRYCILLRVLY